MTSPSKTLLRQTAERFWETVPPTWLRIRNQVRATAVESLGITLEQFHTLRYIRKGMRSVKEVAEAKQISRPAISQAAEVLVAKGLITRRQSGGDRRYVELELTDSGNELLNAIFQKNRAWMMGKLAALSTDELDCLRRGMDALDKAFGEDSD